MYEGSGDCYGRFQKDTLSLAKQRCEWIFNMLGLTYKREKSSNTKIIRWKATGKRDVNFIMTLSEVATISLPLKTARKRKESACQDGSVG